MALTSKELIGRLNELRAAEMRMNIVYRTAAQSVSGPWKDALVKQFHEHAEHENKHADIAMRHIRVLNGEIELSVAELPTWSSFNEMMGVIKDLEKKGVEAWEKLRDDLVPDDMFRNFIGDILSQEQHHYDEAVIWHEESKDNNEVKPEKVDVREAHVQSLPMVAEDLPPDMIVGDRRKFKVWKLSANYLEGEDRVVGEAWQSDDGQVYGTGVCSLMTFEPVSETLYRNSSIGLDESPLSIMAFRLSMSPFVKIEWEIDENDQ